MGTPWYVWKNIGGTELRSSKRRRHGKLHPSWDDEDLTGEMNKLELGKFGHKMEVYVLIEDSLSVGVLQDSAISEIGLRIISSI